MTRRFEQQYEVKRNDDLGDPEFWNRRFQDVDLRLHARELDGQKIDETVDRVEAVALSRLNDTFTPIINEAIERLASVGALFTSTSDSEVTIGVGQKTFLLAAETRTSYVVTEYVAIRPAGHGDRGMIAQVIAYDRATGLLDVNPALIIGAGTYDDWIIRVTGTPDLDHATRTDNPHAVTAAQVGAYTIGAIDAMIAALNTTIGALAPKASPVLTGTPTAPTAALGTNTAQIATMAALLAMRTDLRNEITNGAGVALDQFNELAAAIGNDANYAVNTAASLAKRVRVDGVAGFTAAEMDRARANIDARGFDFLINGSGQVDQEGVATLADTVYGHDQWYALTENAAISKSTVFDAEDGLPAMMRIAQPNATAQRFGYAQVLEGGRSRRLRGKTVNFSGRFRCFTAVPIRFAILEWTGTADVVTRDVVNSWSNGTFTAGQFFAASNLIVRATGSVTPVATVLTDFSINATLGTTFNNLIVMVWTEGSSPLNTTLDFVAHLRRGAIQTSLMFRPYADDLRDCLWYWERTGHGGFFFPGGPGSSNTMYVPIYFLPKRLTQPALVLLQPLTNLAWTSGGGDATPTIFNLVNTGRNRCVAQVTIAGYIGGVQAFEISASGRL